MRRASPPVAWILPAHRPAIQQRHENRVSCRTVHPGAALPWPYGRPYGTRSESAKMANRKRNCARAHAPTTAGLSLTRLATILYNSTFVLVRMILVLSSTLVLVRMVPILSSTSVLQYISTIVFLYYSIFVLLVHLYYSTLVLQYICIIVRLYYSIFVLQYACTIVRLY